MKCINPLHSLLKTLACGVIATLAFTASASAGNVHIPGSKISFQDLGEQLETSLKLAGLGNGDVTIKIEATGLADVTVLNPAQNEPPGQQVGITAAGTQTIPSDQIKNGTVFAALTTEPVNEEDVVVDLPNPLWDIDITDVEFEVVTVTVEQGGEVVFQETFYVL
jgi:hypothetical protein